MRRVVVDSNVLISAFLYPNSNPGRVAQDIERDTIVFVASDQLFREVEAGLEKPYFANRSAAEDRVAWIVSLRAKAELHPDREIVRPITRDKNDDYLVQLYWDNNADLLVSGDPDLLEAHLSDVNVISPAEYVRQIREKGPGDLEC
jgi:uncharacterized protein